MTSVPHNRHDWIVLLFTAQMSGNLNLPREKKNKTITTRLFILVILCVSREAGYANHMKWPWINSNKGRASIRKGHCIEKEKDAWIFFFFYPCHYFIDPFPICPHD